MRNSLNIPLRKATPRDIDQAQIGAVFYVVDECTQEVVELTVSRIVKSDDLGIHLRTNMPFVQNGQTWGRKGEAYLLREDILVRA